VRAGLGAQLGGGAREVEERLLHGTALGVGAAHAWPPSGTGRARRATRRYDPTAPAGSPEVTSASPTRTASAPAAAEASPSGTESAADGATASGAAGA